MNEEKLNRHRISSAEQAEEMGRKGGIESARKKKERKIMSQIYAEALAKKYAIDTKEGPQKMTGVDIVMATVIDVLSKGGPAAVAMMKEIREATEGSKMQTAQEIVVKLDFDTEGI